MNALMQAAREMGFNDAEATLLVTQTFQGAIDLVHQSDVGCSEWIGKVASKGGTTEAALAAFGQSGLFHHVVAGAVAALHRAEELGK